MKITAREMQICHAHSGNWVSVNVVTDPTGPVMTCIWLFAVDLDHLQEGAERCALADEPRRKGLYC